MDTVGFAHMFSINVPHILENIFFCLDYDSFKKCMQVSKSWNELISSDLYLKKAKSIFCEDILKDQDKLYGASFEGKAEVVRSLLRSRMVDANFVGLATYGSEGEKNTRYFMNYESPPICAAASKGNKEVVEVLLDKGADIYKATQYGDVALHWASFNGHLEMVELLLDRGSDPNTAGQYEATPLHYACQKFKLKVIKMLLDRGADPSLRDRFGEFPIMRCAKKKQCRKVAKIMTERLID